MKHSVQCSQVLHPTRAGRSFGGRRLWAFAFTWAAVHFLANAFSACGRIFHSPRTLQVARMALSGTRGLRVPKFPDSARLHPGYRVASIPASTSSLDYDASCFISAKARLARHTCRVCWWKCGSAGSVIARWPSAGWKGVKTIWPCDTTRSAAWVP